VKPILKASKRVNKGKAFAEDKQDFSEKLSDLRKNKYKKIKFYNEEFRAKAIESDKLLIENLRK
jgi:folate-dependent tRNA-U54 methylase TrmFO/GidA